MKIDDYEMLWTIEEAIKDNKVFKEWERNIID